MTSGTDRLRRSASSVAETVTGRPPPEAVAAVEAAEEPAATSEPVLGICLSGGGSRALTGALGALSGLRSLPDPGGGPGTVLDRVDHISSVSGGSWASVLFTFLPENVEGKPIDDDTFLIGPVEPDRLVKDGGTPADANVEYMDPRCLGIGPQQFSVEPIARVLLKYFRWGLFADNEKWRWFWIAAIGELLLRPFGLYDAKYPRRSDVTQPSKFFAPSAEYVGSEITPHNRDLTADQFHLVRPGRPGLVVNFNVLEDESIQDPVQVPIQATPAITGVLGAGPNGVITGGGSVQSFGFATTLHGSGAEPDTVNVGLDRRYSLSDIAGCSSAFFAEQLLQFVSRELGTIEEAIGKELRACHVPGFLTRWAARLVCRRIEKDFDAGASDVIPRYPYWSYREIGAPDPTADRGFSDGGSFEDTGVLGMLARTNANRIIVFANGAAPLARADSGEITVDGQVATLFGLTFDKTTGRYQRYADQTPPAERRLAQVFDDSNGEFDALRLGLWEASTGGGGDEHLGTNTVAFVQQLTTIDNPVANISAGRAVTVLWVLNNRVNAWQDAITDDGIKADLAKGQAGQRRDGTGGGAGKAEGPLANFPLYTTAGQIHLDPEGVNMLAQLAAWNVHQLADDIAAMLAG